MKHGCRRVGGGSHELKRIHHAHSRPVRAHASHEQGVRSLESISAPEKEQKGIGASPARGGDAGGSRRMASGVAAGPSTGQQSARKLKASRYSRCARNGPATALLHRKRPRSS